MQLCQCYSFLGDARGVATELLDLVASGTREGDGSGGGSDVDAQGTAEAEVAVLTAYQAALDLVDNGNQQFLIAVHDLLPSGEEKSADAAAAAATEASAVEDDGEGGDDAAETSATATAASDAPAAAAAAASSATPLSAAAQVHVTKLRDILVGTFVHDIYLEFLLSSDKADQLLLKRIREKLTAKARRFNSVLHTGLVLCNAFMHAGTLKDDFLRWKETQAWLPKLKNWSQFTAVAANGVLHRRHIRGGKSMKVLDEFLAADGNTKGGACYALGLIHAGLSRADKGAALKYLTDTIDATPFAFPDNAASKNIPELHGAILGTGLAAMGTHDRALFSKLYELATGGQDNADVGEAMGYALGLIMLGSGDITLASEELMKVAVESPHEKITRSFSFAAALVMYGQEEVRQSAE